MAWMRLDRGEVLSVGNDARESEFFIRIRVFGCLLDDGVVTLEQSRASWKGLQERQVLIWSSAKSLHIDR